MISFFSALAIVFHVSIDGEVKLSKSDVKVGFLQIKRMSRLGVYRYFMSWVFTDLKKKVSIINF